MKEFESKSDRPPQWESISLPCISLRDWFAGMAMQGLVAFPGDENSGNYHNKGNFRDMADDAYFIADLMLVARSKGGAE